MKKINYLFSIILSVALLACQPGDSISQNQNAQVAQGQEGIAISLNSSEWINMMNKKPGAIIDVRTEGEFLQGHIEGGQLADYTSSEFVSYIEDLSLDKSQPVYIYCRSGNRSKKAITILKNQGFIEIYELNKGILGWQADNNKVIK